jgi:nucleolar MIF4G domain-containing protein 1
MPSSPFPFSSSSFFSSSPQDYLDAFERLMNLKLQNKQDREIVRVIMECCLQEKIYNPFYALVGQKLCEHSHNHRMSFQVRGCAFF